MDWIELTQDGDRWRSLVNALTINLPTTTIVAQTFKIIKLQLKFNPVA